MASKPSSKRAQAEQVHLDYLDAVHNCPDDLLLDHVVTAFRIGQETVRAGQPALSDADLSAVRLKYLADRIEGALKELKEHAERCMEEHAKLKATMAEAVKVAASCELMADLIRRAQGDAK